MMIEYFLGVDGGGSKTHCALFDRSCKMVDFLEWGTTSHEFLPGGYDELKDELKKMLNKISSRNHLDYERVEAVFGMAGVDCRRQCEIIGEYIKQCGVGYFYLCNDSYLGIKAATDKGWGVCSLNGSGTGACGIDPNGKSYNVGALFELSGDYAGGRILGTEVVKHVYDMLYRDGKSTYLCELLQKEMNAINKAELMEKIICGISDYTLELKEFAPLLFEAALMGDLVALEILEKSGKQNARDIQSIIEELDFPDDEEIPLILLGSLYTKSKHDGIITALKNSLRNALPDKSFNSIRLSVPPVTGAVCWAMDRSGVENNRVMIGSIIDRHVNG